jgi:hypothetical protein
MKSFKEEESGSQILPRTTHVAQSGPCYGSKWLHGAESFSETNGYSDGQEVFRL